MPKPVESPPGTSAQIHAARIGLIGALVVAVCGLLGTTLTVAGAALNAYFSSQAAQAAVLLPIYATQTAEARAAALSAVPVSPAPSKSPPEAQPTPSNAPVSPAPSKSPEARPTPSSVPATPVPSPGPAAFLVKNKLILSIRIFVNDQYSGEVEAQSEQVFHLDRDPVQVRWEIVKETTAEGKPLGDDMGATFNSVTRGAVITVTNIVGDQAYFYPFISNHTDTDCEVTINMGWKSENVTKAAVPAGKDDVGLGYFRLYTNSNVTLNCDGSIRWWGLRPEEKSDSSFSDDVDAETGAIHFTLEP